jgi:BRCA1-associated protein
VCHVVFVKDVEYTCTPAPPPPGQTVCAAAASALIRQGLTPLAQELPACPVCLERLDTHISGIVTTVCNHTFHSACLSKWADSSCPVCRYSQEPPDKPECAVCGTTDNLWICIICGYVGCGRHALSRARLLRSNTHSASLALRRYASGHAVLHWRDTDHCYSLELDTQRVWDYLGDGYVHRLIASKTHGHLVELSPPVRWLLRAPASAARQLARRSEAHAECFIPSCALRSTRARGGTAAAATRAPPAARARAAAAAAATAARARTRTSWTRR